ncbi:hypothetical protein UlMin_005210 [Ulmus minor]
MADLQGYIILSLVCLVTTILFRAIYNKTRTKACLPPSPPRLPIIGHLRLLGPIPHQSLHKLSNQYGPLIQLYLGSVPFVVASSPEIAKEFLKTQEISFSNRAKISTAIDYLTYGSADISFAPYGPFWKFMKKICMSELFCGRRLDQFAPIKHQEIRSFLHLVLKKAEAREVVDVRGELIRMINNVISRMAVSKRCSGSENDADEIRKLVTDTVGVAGKFNVSDYFPVLKKLDVQGYGKRLKEIRERFDNMMERIMKEHEEARKKEKEGGDDTVKDFLDILVDISEDESSEIRLSRENIKAFMLDIFTGGTDTSAITTEWALAEVINNPNIMNKAREELDSVIGKTRLVQESDITNLPYLQAIVKETLRLHPPGPIIMRESYEKCTVNGYNIPEHTKLFVNVWAIGRDPNHWENPLEFKPERFLAEEGSGKSRLDVRGQQFHFLPFGSGRRGCPGTSLALQIVQTSLAAMIQCFEWKIDGGNGSVDMEEGAGVSLPMAHPLICVPVTRLSPITL